VSPAVPDCMVLYDELRSHRCSVAQRERCRPVQLFVCERSHCSSDLTTVATQEFESGLFCNTGMLFGMPCIQLGDDF
jgi:hypothetical protein